MTVPFRIRNLGTETLTIEGKSVTGANAGDFTIRNLPTGVLGNTTIGAGSHIDFDVEFEPSAAGTRNATIVLDTNDDDENPYSFAIRAVEQDPELFPEIRIVSSGAGTITHGDSSPTLAKGTDFGNPTVGDSSLSNNFIICLLYTSPSPRDKRQSRMPSSA